jgi:hypothetical protein
MTTRTEPTAAAEAFFYKHAGYSYRPDVETEEEGRRRTARDLATAERWARDVGITFRWSEDWTVDSHRDVYGEGSVYEDGEPDTCESCTAYLRGAVVAGLYCIDDATEEYRRVVEAELASEAMDEAARDEAAALAWGGLA